MASKESLFVHHIKKSRNILKCTTTSELIDEKSRSVRVYRVISDAENEGVVEVARKLVFSNGARKGEQVHQFADSYLSTILWDRILQYAPAQLPYHDAELSIAGLGNNWTVTHLTAPCPAVESDKQAPQVVAEKPLKVALFTFTLYFGVSDDLDGAVRTFNAGTDDEAQVWPCNGLAVLCPCDLPAVDSEIAAGSLFRLSTDIYFERK